MAGTRQIKIEILGDDKSGSSALKGLGDAAGHADTKLGTLTGTLTNVGGAGISALGALGTVGVAGIVGLGGAVVTTGIQFNTMKEQATIAFTTMLGDGGKAKTFLDNLAAFAAATPFEFPDLVTASQKLLAMGFAADDVIPTLTSIGNAVAGMGGSAEMVDRVTLAFGQMNAKGKASAEDIAQLTEAGIPAWKYLADLLGVDVATAMDMVSKGQVSATQAISAFKAGMDKDFGGMMEAQSKTMAGLWSTLKDTFTQASGTIIMPLFQALTAGMTNLAAALADPSFAAGVSAIGESLGQGIGLVVQGFTAALPYIQAFGSAIASMQPYMVALGDALLNGMALAFQVIGPVLGTIVAQFSGLSASLAPMQGLLVTLGPLWTALQPPLTLIAELLGGALIINVGLVLAALGGLAGFLTGGLPGALQAVTGMIQVFTGTLNLITSTVQGVVAIVSALIHGDWAGAWTAAQTMVQNMATAVQTIIGGMGTIVLGLFNTLIGGVTGAIGGFATTLGTYFDGIATAIGGSVRGMATDVSTGFDNMASAVTTKVGEVVTFARGIPGQLQSALGNLGSLLFNAGSSLIQGLIDGIASKIGELKGMLGGITKLLPDWKGPESVDKKILFPSGQWVMQGFIDGILSEVGTIMGTLGGITTALPGAVDMFTGVLGGIGPLLSGAPIGPLLPGGHIGAPIPGVNPVTGQPYAAQEHSGSNVGGWRPPVPAPTGGGGAAPIIAAGTASGNAGVEARLDTIISLIRDYAARAGNGAGLMAIAETVAGIFVNAAGSVGNETVAAPSAGWR